MLNQKSCASLVTSLWYADMASLRRGIPLSLYAKGLSGVVMITAWRKNVNKHIKSEILMWKIYFSCQLSRLRNNSIVTFKCRPAQTWSDILENKDPADPPYFIEIAIDGFCIHEIVRWWVDNHSKDHRRANNLVEQDRTTNERVLHEHSSCMKIIKSATRPERKRPLTQCDCIDLQPCQRSDNQRLLWSNCTFVTPCPTVSWSEIRHTNLQRSGIVGWGCRRSPVANAGTPSKTSFVLVGQWVSPLW